ncbi:MAG: metal-sensing transcriptional repressor, partial [bacterium]
SVQEALSQVNKLMLRNYLETCASKAIRSGVSPKVYDEIMNVIYKYLKQGILGELKKEGDAWPGIQSAG